MTLSDIENDLVKISNELNLEGPSINALIKLLSKALYDNELCTTNLLLEGSLSRSRNLNSRITAASDLGYSVYRGTNQKFNFKNLVYVFSDSVEVKKYDLLTNYGKYGIYYAHDYQFSNSDPIVDIECIVAKNKQSIPITIDQSNKMMVYVPVNDISNDLVIKVNGKIVPHQEGLFYGTNGDSNYVIEDKRLCVITITGFGIVIINRDHDSVNAFKEGDLIEVEYLEYLSENIDISGMKSIDRFSYSSSINYESINFDPRNESKDLIYYNALTNFRNSYTIKSDDDIKSIIETYFAKYILGSNIRKTYVTNNYTTMLVPAQTQVRNEVNIVEGELSEDRKALISLNSGLEIDKTTIDSKEVYKLFDGQYASVNSRLTGYFKFTFSLEDHEGETIEVTHAPTSVDEEVNFSEVIPNLDSSNWIFNVSFKENLLSISLDTIDSTGSPIELKDNNKISISYKYKNYIGDVASDEIEGNVSAQVFNLSSSVTTGYLVEDLNGDEIKPIDGSYKINSEIKLSNSIKNTIQIFYLIGNESYRFTKLDSLDNYIYELKLNDSKYTINILDEFDYSNTYLKISEGNLQSGSIVMYHILNDKMNIRFCDLDGVQLSNQVKIYNCDDGEFTKDYPNTDAGEGFVTLPILDREKLWIIQLDGITFDEGSLYEGIYFIDNDDTENKFSYGPGNLLHIDTYYTNKDDLEIPSNDITSFKEMIKLVYYVDNVTFKFEQATELTEFPIGENIDSSSEILPIEEFDNGYPLDIVVNYSYSSSLSSIRSSINSIVSKYKYLIGNKFNMYELLAEIQSISGVKYVSLNNLEVLPIVQLSENQYMLIDTSKITYNPINDISKNVGYRRT